MHDVVPPANRESNTSLGVFHQPFSKLSRKFVGQPGCSRLRPLTTRWRISVISAALEGRSTTKAPVNNAIKVARSRNVKPGVLSSPRVWFRLR